MRSYDKLADMLAEYFRSRLESTKEQRLDEVVIQARMSWVKLWVGDGAQNSEPFLQRRGLRMDIEDGRGIIIPEVMVFGASGVGKRVKVRGVGDDVGGAGKRPQGERHGRRC